MTLGRRFLLIPCLCAAAAAALAGPGAAQQDHAIAIINDPMSHGAVGDTKLSLNEVILLNKRAISIAQLSELEAAQIFGLPGQDVATGDIDASMVSTITVERDLDAIADLPHGLSVSGSNGRPTIDFRNNRGFRSSSNFLLFLNLKLKNTAVAIESTLTEGFGAWVDGCEFESITDTAVKVTMATDNHSNALTVANSTFRNVPKAVEVFNTGSNRTDIMELNGLDVRGGQLGVGIHLGPGGTLAVTMLGNDLAGVTNGIVFDRPAPGDTRRVTLDGLYVNIAGGSTAFSFEGHAAVADSLTMHVADLDGSAYGLRAWPLGTGLTALVEDTRLGGATELLTGNGPGLLLRNVRAKNGALRLGANGAPIRVTDSILDQVSTSTQGTSPVQIDASRLVAGSLQGTTTAPITIQGSHMGGATTGANVTTTAPLPQPQLGSMDMSTLTPSRGTSTTLQVDLPPGLIGVPVIGLAEQLPIYGPPNIYFWLSIHTVVSIAMTGQQQLTIPVRGGPFFIGWEVFVQLVTVDLGVIPGAAPLTLPPGRKVVIR